MKVAPGRFQFAPLFCINGFESGFCTELVFSDLVRSRRLCGQQNLGGSPIRFLLRNKMPNL